MSPDYPKINRAFVSSKIFQNKMGIKNPKKKATLTKLGRRTKWAPVWAIIKKHGTTSAKMHHVSEITRQKRSWKRTKLRIKPRKMRKWHMG